MDSWHRNFVIVILALLLIFAAQARGDMIEGAYDYNQCNYEWRAYAQNGGYWLAGSSNLYMIGHGYYGVIYRNCFKTPVYPADIAPGYDFIFVGICDGMNEVGAGTFSSRAKESVGYTHMSEGQCASCWSRTLAFQDYLFRRHAEGNPWSVAYDQTISAFPECGACTKYFNRAADVVQKVIAPYLAR